MDVGFLHCISETTHYTSLNRSLSPRMVEADISRGVPQLLFFIILEQIACEVVQKDMKSLDKRIEHIDPDCLFDLVHGSSLLLSVYN